MRDIEADNAAIISALESRLDRSLTPLERLTMCNIPERGDLLQTLGIDRLDVPKLGDGGGFAIERTGMLYGYQVEKVSDEPGKLAYYLHGPKVTYRLMRCMTHHHVLYVLNSKGNICNIKGNYKFADDSGRLRSVS
jgi:hypothetical protein